jgi:hypothetical protein
MRAAHMKAFFAEDTDKSRQKAIIPGEQRPTQPGQYPSAFRVRAEAAKGRPPDRAYKHQIGATMLAQQGQHLPCGPQPYIIMWPGFNNSGFRKSGKSENVNRPSCCRYGLRDRAGQRPATGQNTHATGGRIHALSIS